MSYTNQLYQLQQIDSKIDAINRRLQEISDSLTETAALKSARLAMTQAETDYNQSKAAQTDLDLEVKSLQQKITNHERRLYSGKVTSPKEAASLQDEVASSKKWLSKKEEDLLEAMIMLEDAESTLADKKQAFSQVKAQWEADQANLLQEQVYKREGVAELSQKRKTTSYLVDETDLKRYEALRKQRAGIAVAGARDGNCQSCGVLHSSRLTQQASTDSQLFFCDGCGRIIHIL